jgi:hypothetical protein
MGKADAAKVASLKPKKKCCRSRKRCVRCPVVIKKMQRAQDDGLQGKHLRKALRAAREG